MLNAEKYKDGVKEHKGVFGVSKDGEVIICMSANCQEGKCIFSTPGSCFSKRALWLVEEVQPQSHEEILKLLEKTNGVFAVNKHTGEIYPCENFTNCGNCVFADSNHRCEENRYHWLVQHGFIK